MESKSTTSTKTLEKQHCSFGGGGGTKKQVLLRKTAALCLQAPAKRFTSC